MKGRFPVYVLSITVPTDSVDVNVHPSKREVKFDNPNKMFSIVRKAVENALLSVDQIASFIADDEQTQSSLYSNQPQNNNVSESLPSFSQASSLASQEENKTSLQNANYQNNDAFNKTNFENATKDTYIKNSGKSFSIDLIDPNSKLASPEEFEIEIKKNEKSSDEIDDLSNMSLKGRYIVESKDDSTFFFDQSGEKFTSSIMAKSQSEKFLNASVKDEMKILGTLFKTYIVIELQDSVYFIDQHAAHERLLYDKLVKQINENNINKQDLLVPYSFTLGAKESQNLDLALDELRKMGFDIEKNDYRYEIKSVPLVLSFIELDKFVDELVKDSINWDKKPSDYIHNKLCQTACKHAIKAGDSISKDECAYIIEQVRKGVMLCPHGRPITLVISNREFEKMFKRIV